MSKWTVIESQLSADDEMGLLTYSFNAEDEAWSKYHAVLSAAAVSTVAEHGATLLVGAGNFVTNKVFTHSTTEGES